MLYSQTLFRLHFQTDHDPRAPAYVAAQGPLPTTLAHFWQMIWEQGAVVIVSLCRLQENGEIACARYWPEEGAEVYHIYEVGGGSSDKAKADFVVFLCQLFTLLRSTW